MNLDCIAQTLIDNGLAQALGVDIFTFHFPADVNEGLLLRLPMEGVPINHYIPGFYRGRFQVIVRSKSIATGKDKSTLVNSALDLTERIYLDTHGDTTMRILRSYPLHLPISYPRTDANVYEWSCNFLAHYVTMKP